MPFNGSGTYSFPSNSFNPAVAGTTINPTDWNATAVDLATALSTTITKDGQSTTTARIPFANGIATDTITEQTAAAGVTADGTLLKDGNITLSDASVASKKATFNMSGISSATTRTFAWPDANGTVALTSDITSTLTVGTTAISGGTNGRILFDNSAVLGEKAVTGTGDVVLATSPTLVTPKSSTTIGVGNATPAASGAGVTFPATQDPSTDVNTLDDYEEGTFTPVLTFATPGDLSVAYTAQLGVYTKIGNVVYVNVVITTSAFTHTTASGDLSITGLPFTSRNTVSLSHRAALVYSGITKAGFTEIAAQVQPNSAALIGVAVGSGATPTPVAAADMPTGGTVRFQTSLFYFI